MDSSKYIRETRLNQWAVNFANRNAISVNEVKKIFSEFGEIGKVSQTGDSTGLCFVNYKNQDDAERCVDGLRGHKLIQLRENRLNKYRETRDSGQQNSNFADNDFDFVKKDDFTDDFTMETEQRPNSNRVAYVNKQDSAVNEISNEYDVVVECDMDDKVIKKLIDLKNRNGVSPSTFDLLTGGHNVDTETKVVNNDEDDPEMPDLVERFEKTTVTDEDGENIYPRIVEAQEVIVANIPTDYGTNYILHLVEKYEPLAASYIKIAEPHSVRYCHVYFTSAEAADQVVTKLDNFELGIKKLIVLRGNFKANFRTA